jgi:hypothetical protein
MNLIGQEMSEIQDIDYRCAKKKQTLKRSCAPNIDISRGGERSRYLTHVTALGYVPEISPIFNIST